VFIIFLAIFSPVMYCTHVDSVYFLGKHVCCCIDELYAG